MRCHIETICELTSSDFSEKLPWNDELDDNLMQAAYDALQEGVLKELEKLKGMLSWSGNVAMDIRSQFVDCSSDSTEQERLDRWACANYAKRLLRQVGRKGSLTMSYMRVTCQRQLMFTLRLEPGRAGRRRLRVPKCCASFLVAMSASPVVRLAS